MLTSLWEWLLHKIVAQLQRPELLSNYPRAAECFRIDEFCLYLGASR